MRYPLALKKDRNGTIIAQAVDAPSALTVGLDEADASAQAVDALITLFAALMAEGQPIPRPSRPKRGGPVATLPPMVTAKLAIYQAMRDAGLNQSALAERLGAIPRSAGCSTSTTIPVSTSSKVRSPPPASVLSSRCKTPRDHDKRDARAGMLPSRALEIGRPLLE